MATPHPKSTARATTVRAAALAAACVCALLALAPSAHAVASSPANTARGLLGLGIRVGAGGALVHTKRGTAVVGPRGGLAVTRTTRALVPPVRATTTVPAAKAVVPATATPAPSTTTPTPGGSASAVKAVAVRPATPSHRGHHTSTAAILVAVLAAVVALACVGWAIARLLAYEPRWSLSLRHALAEAGFRMSATWAEFSDWARPGR